MASRDLSFSIFARDNASSSFAKVGKAAEGTGRSMGILSAHFGHFGAAVKTGVGLAIGAAGIGGLVETFKGFYSEAVEAQKAGAQTAAVIKSTGGVAGVSAKQIGDLAGSISNKVGVDDEAIQSGENLLLTFKNVRNESGKGKDIFNQATQAIVDMTAGMNNGTVTAEGLKTSTIQVGKALNDPIKGMTALAKVGVTFSKQQKDQIANFVAHGQLAKAQGIILKELGSEFGGSAEASATAGQKLGVVWGNIKEQIGTALLPAFDAAATWLSAKIPGALAVASRWFAAGKVGVLALAAAFRNGRVTSGGFVGFMQQAGVQARNAFNTFKTEVLPRLKEFGGYLRGTVIPALVGFGGWLVRMRGWLIPIGAGILAVVAAMRVWTEVTKVLAAAQVLLNVVLDANPVGAVILAIVALSAAFVVAYERSAEFRAIVDQVTKNVIHAFENTVHAAQNTVHAFGNIVHASENVVHAGGNIVHAGANVVHAFGNVVHAGGNVVHAGGNVVHAFGNVVHAGGNVVHAGGNVVHAFANVGHAAANTYRAVVGAWGSMLYFVSGLPGRITRITSGMWNGVTAAFRASINAIVGMWNRLHIPGVGIDFDKGPVHIHAHTPDINFPDIPYLAGGGVIRARPGGVLAVLGEAGRDEAVIPLSRSAPALDSRPILVQLFLDGKVIQESLLTRQRQTGALGFA